jgi:hypothetical protein
MTEINPSMKIIARYLALVVACGLVMGGVSKTCQGKSRQKASEMVKESLTNKTHTTKRLTMDFITHLQQTLTQQIPEIMEGYAGNSCAKSLSEMEVALKQMLHEVGNAILGQWLEAQEQKYPDDCKKCVHCGAEANYVRRRQGMSITLQGRVYYRRAYYSCPNCEQGFYPLDERLGIEAGQMSSEVVQLAALFGIEDAFGMGHDLLQRATLLDLSPNSIRKASQRMGQRVAAHEDNLHERSQSLEGQRDQQRNAVKPQRLYGSLDGFMVLLADGWHEMKAGTWWTNTLSKQGENKAQNIHYYTDLLPAQDFSDLVWATGFDHHADQAQELIFVADGAEWIWNIVQQHYPQAVQIVDWYHACEYIAPVAKVAFKDPLAREHWIQAVKTALWEGQLEAVIAACQAYVDPDLKREHDPAQQAVTYYHNNQHRMNYPHYRAQGYQIGSGIMESGCKRVGLERLKIAGARWSREGACLVAKARAAYLSGDWDKLNAWADTLPQVA